MFKFTSTHRFRNSKTFLITFASCSNPKADYIDTYPTFLNMKSDIRELRRRFWKTCTMTLINMLTNSSAKPTHSHAQRAPLY